MSLKILCAGYGKDEKFDLEKQVRSMFGRRGSETWTISLVKLGGQVQVTVDGPDERLRNKCFMADPRHLQDALGDLLKNHGVDLPDPEEAPPPARPAPVAAPRPAPAPKPAAIVARPAPAKPAAPVAVKPAAAPAATKRPDAEPARSWIPAPPRAVTPAPSAPARPAPAARPAAPATSSVRPPAPAPTSAPRGKATPPRATPASAPGGLHEGRDTHTCPSCSGAFVVTYEIHGNEPRQLVAVACPHCWKLDHVEVAEGAAIGRTYRADKA